MIITYATEKNKYLSEINDKINRTILLRPALDLITNSWSSGSQNIHNTSTKHGPRNSN